MPRPRLDSCPCGSGTTLQECCARYHAGPLHLQAPTAEALMRSRYSAFVAGLGDYLLATWHPHTRPLTIEPNEAGLKWLGLEVKCHSAATDDNADANHAIVEFVARSKLAGRAHRLHEVSRFVREDGRWYYVDGSDGNAGSAASPP